MNKRGCWATEEPEPPSGGSVRGEPLLLGQPPDEPLTGIGQQLLLQPLDDLLPADGGRDQQAQASDGGRLLLSIGLAGP